MKSYIDREQSKKLAEILPIECADMCWIGEIGPLWGVAKSEPDDDFEVIPSWSLAALIEQLPIIDGSRPLVSFALNGDCDISYFLASTADVLWTHASNLLDACYEMILKLKEKDLL